MSLPNDTIDWDEIFDSLTIDFKSPWKAAAIGILLRAVIDWWKTRGTEKARMMLENHCSLCKSKEFEGVTSIYRFAEEFNFGVPQEELHIFLSSGWCRDLFDFIGVTDYNVAMRAIGFRRNTYSNLTNF